MNEWAIVSEWAEIGIPNAEYQRLIDKYDDSEFPAMPTSQEWVRVNYKGLSCLIVEDCMKEGRLRYRIKEEPKTTTLYYIEHLTGSLAGRVDIQSNCKSAAELPDQFRVVKTEEIELTPKQEGE